MLSATAIEKDFLKCIYEYFQKASVTQASLYSGYIQVFRRTHIITIMMTGSVANVEIRGVSNMPNIHSKTVDLCEPGSLQRILEITMSKKNK